MEGTDVEVQDENNSQREESPEREEKTEMEEKLEEKTPTKKEESREKGRSKNESEDRKERSRRSRRSRSRSRSPDAKKRRDDRDKASRSRSPEIRKRRDDRDRSRSRSADMKRRRDDRERSRSRSPEVRRRRDDRERSRSRSPETRRRREDRDKTSRSRSPEARRRRDEREKNGDNAEARKRSEDSQEDMEEGEVKETPKPLSKRELERLRLIKEMEEQDADEDTEEAKARKIQEQEATSKTCPYLDTIDRTVLDFDFEKLCSVSLSTMNVYACMVCGRYFQGRGTNTHAYTHSLDNDHRVFLNLQTLKFYCLPDNYEIVDPSLGDITYVLKPTYSKALISSLDTQAKMARAYDDSMYYPGVVGLNNIKANDYCNVVLQALSHVVPLRNYFLQEENYCNLKRPPGDKLFELPKRFGELMRKLWNPKAFRKHVSPHEMLQASVLCSEKKFQITEQSDAAEFMTFILNTLHTALNGNQKTSSSIIYKTFRGRMRQYSRQIVPAEATDDQTRELLQLPAYQESSKEFPFLYLSMDLPPAPLYRDAQLENIIPQVPLQVLLSKFNGQTEKEYKTYKENIMKRFEILRLPEYLVVMYKRFHKNQWFVEKNPTIVNFPITNVDLYDCLSDEAKPLHKYTTYDLIGNVVHDGTPENGNYRIQLLHQGSQKWFQLEDLHVEEILPQVINLAEAYIQIWRMNKKLTRDERIAETPEEVVEPIPGLQMSNPFNPQLPPKVE